MKYRTDLEGVRPELLQDFCADWPQRPSPSRLFRALQNADFVAVAWSEDERQLRGFAYVVTDKELFAFLPLIEVRAEDQGKGVGSRLMDILIDQTEGFYALDLLCDEPLRRFYGKFGMQPLLGMVIRRPEALQD